MVSQMELQMHERATLGRIMAWGDDPTGECDVEALERHHEAALADRTHANESSEGGQ